VLVHGTRREIGQTTLSAAEVRQVPGAFGDPFRAVDMLPGVVPLQSGVPYFYIRGAPPNDNGYYIDGIRVPLLFHVGLGEGVIHPALIDHVDFFPGAAPASYGGVAGATIKGQTRDPAPAPPAAALSAEPAPRELRSEAARSPSPSASASAPSAFRGGMAALERGDNRQAANLFRDFIGKHPGDRRAEDAAYLRAIALQRCGDATGTQEAAREYLQRYRDGFRRLEMEQLSR
jgi:outer membrane receptor protein involved in Fe transport